VKKKKTQNIFDIFTKFEIHKYSSIYPPFLEQETIFVKDGLVKQFRRNKDAS